MKWFRVYNEARNDAKLRNLTPPQHLVWFNLLCFANEQPARGTITGMSLKRIAIEVINGDVDMLMSGLEALQEVQGVTWRCIAIQGDTGRYTPESIVEIVFPTFMERQYIKPSDMPERVKDRVAKSRGNKRSNRKPKCNAPVTPGNALETRCNVPDSEYSNSSVEEPPTPLKGDQPPPIEPTFTLEPTPVPEPEAAPRQTPKAAPPARVDPRPEGFREAIGVARELLGPDEAGNLGRSLKQLRGKVGDRWECLIAAIRMTAYDRAQPGGQRIDRPVGYAINLAEGYASVDEPPPEVPGPKPKITLYPRIEFTAEQRQRAANPKRPGSIPPDPDWPLRAVMESVERNRVRTGSEG